MHLQPAPLKGLIGHSFSLVTIEFGAQSDLLCAPNFHPTISNRMTFHLPLLGSLRRRCCFQARPCLCLSADWCYIWFATWVYISSVKPALQWPSILGTVFMLVSVYSVFRTSRIFDLTEILDTTEKLPEPDQLARMLSQKTWG